MERNQTNNLRKEIFHIGRKWCGSAFVDYVERSRSITTIIYETAMKMFWSRVDYNKPEAKLIVHAISLLNFIGYISDYEMLPEWYVREE